MNLYKLTLKNYKDYYVVEEDPTKAQEKLIKYLNEIDYYFSCDRVVIVINLIGCTVDNYSKKDIEIENIFSAKV